MPRKINVRCWEVVDVALVQLLEAQARISERTRLEMEVGALNISAEQWLHQISYMLMVQMMHELVFPQRVQ
jgi:hypothetical protein